MRSKYLLLCVLGLLTFAQTRLYSQSKSPAFINQNYGDSLRGFDELSVRQEGLSEGIYGKPLETLIEARRRWFIYAKYDFHNYNQAANPGAIGNFNYKGLGGNGIVNNAPCVNEGFENGNISGWTATRGTNTNSCAYPVTPIGVAFPTNSFITMSVTPFTDPIVGFTVAASPFAGNKVIRLNDGYYNNGECVRIAQTMPITNNNFLYEFAYMAVMASAHTCCAQSYMRVSVRDNVGNLLACPLFTFAPPPPTGPSCSSPGITWSITTVNNGQGSFQIAFNPTWQKYSIDLTNYIGTNVSIEVTVSDCSPTGHFGYAYFDSNCNQLGFTLNGSTFFAAPTQTVNIAAICAQQATLSAPAGLGPYTWNGPPGSGITSNTNQTIQTSVAGAYTISMNPNGACTPINRIINLNFAPPATVTASSPSICSSGSNTTAVLTATGASSYTWQPGGSNSATLTVSPASSTIYSLTAQSGTCVGYYTVPITVNITPTISITNNNPVTCSGGTTQLIGSGASTYSWNPVGLTGGTVVVTTSATTIYTAIGTSTAGCIDTETTQVFITTAVTPTLFNLTNPTSSVCAGTPVTLVGAGFATFSWVPTSPLVTGAVVSISPTITTTYTAIGGAGSCTNTATITVLVDQGPTMTVTSSPTIICPGNSATLNANAPTAVGYTWTPPGGTGASSLIVTPTITTNYSVTGINAAGCKRTYTIDQNVAPVPVITITPASPTVCIGSTINLVATGGNTYTWNPGGILSATNSVSPNINTSYIVTASNGTCSSNAGITVTVVPVPLVGAGVSPTAICVGQFATLTGSGANNYTWQPGGATTQTVSVSPGAGTTNYTVTGNSLGCTATATTSLLVNINPTISVVASPTAVCPSFCSTLIPSGASTYTFVTSNVVCPSVTTTYSVTGTNLFGCVSVNPGTVSVVVNPTPNIVIAASAPSICMGSSATFTATGGTGYTWTPGNMATSVVVVSPTVTTVYTVTGVNSFGCITQKTVNLTVVPLPIVTGTANPAAICVGFTSTLTAGGATTYTWLPGPLLGGVVTVTPPATTIYTLTGNALGCNSSTFVTVTVNTGPTLSVTATPTAVCPTFCSTLTTSGSGVSFTWNPGGSNGPTLNACPVSTTIYTVSASSAFGCITTQTINLPVNSLPVLTVTASSPSICAGGNVTFTATGASSYSWAPVGLFGNVVTVTPAITTVYTVTGTSSLGCNNTKTLQVIVVPLPPVTASASPVTVCAGSPVILTGGGATSYTWSPGPVVGSPVTVTPTISTTYTVTGLSGGCTNTATAAVAVNAVPTITTAASSTAVCSLGCATLTATGTASTYTWNPGPVFGASINACPVVTTIYTVSGTNAAGCQTTKTIQLVVNPAPSISIAATAASICAGSSVTYSATGASSYTWSPGGSNSSVVSFTPASSTTYTVNGTSAAGCTGSQTVSILVVPLPNVFITATPAGICVGSSATLTGNGGTTYTWSTGSNATSITVNPPSSTNYTVTGSSLGCSKSATIALLVSNPPSFTVAASPGTICPGFTSAITATGAVSYTVFPGGITPLPAAVSPTSTTTYSVVGTSAAGCTNTFVTSVVVNPSPTVIASSANATQCAGSSNTLTGTGAISFTWLPAGGTGSNVTVNPTVTTTYTASGTSSLGCISQGTVLVTVTPNPTLGATTSPTAICNGFSVTLTATGGANYTWTPGPVTGTTAVVSPTSTQVYTVNGSLNGCSGFATVQVVVNNSPTLNTTASPTAICRGNNALVSASGATSYTWSTGSNASAIFVSPTITTVYTVTGGNVFGCKSTKTVQLVVNQIPSLTISPSSFTICPGGFVVLTATGATTYTWLPGPTNGNTLSAGPLATTVYTISGSTSGCTGSTTAMVVVATIPTLAISASPASVCPGGSSTLIVNGATNYTWSTGANGNSIVVTPTATTGYTVLGDNGFCSTVTAITVTLNAVPVITTAVTPTATCPGNTATLTAGGASGYTWNPGGLTGASPTVNPLTSTNYTVTGINGSGCTSTAAVNLLVNPSPSVVPSATPAVICSGQSATLSATGATTYTWNPGVMTGSSVPVTPTVNTTYTVVGTLGTCTSVATIILTVNPIPVITVTASPAAICFGSTATLSALGATGYTWNPGNVNLSSFTVSPGSTTLYTVTGANNFGCISTQTLNLTVNTIPTLSVSSTSNPLCSGSSATLTGSGTLTFTWLPGGSTNTTIVVNPLVNTTYTLSGSNGANCSNTAVYVLTVNATPTVVLSTTSASVCAGYSTALMATGATNYTWTPGNQTGSMVVVSPTTTTTYTALGESNGCSSSKTISIIAVPLPTVTATASQPTICLGASSTLTANGAASYTWLPSLTTGTSLTVTPLSTSVYTVVGLAATGCPNFGTVQVTVLPTPTVTGSASPTAICIGGSATLTGGGATNYTWNPGAQTGTSVIVNPTVTTTYTVTGDNGGCTGTGTLSLVVNPLPTLSLTINPTVVCAGGTVNLTASGANNYTWTPMGTTGASITDTPTLSITYTAVGADANGCKNTANISVSVNPLPVIIPVATPSAICQGGTVSLSATGAGNYSWSPGALVGSPVSYTPAVTTTYSASGTDTNGCIGSSTITVNVFPTPTVSASPLNASVCAGSPATLTATGATNYTWLPAGGNASAAVVSPTSTTVYTVTGDNGGTCFNSFTVSVFVNPLPANVTATCSGTITCQSPSVSLSGSSSNTTVTYSWSGPSGYTSAAQNPTGVTVWGTFTLNVTNINTGCVASVTVLVPTDNSIPSVTATTSGSITCAAATVTLNAANITATAGYVWSGPGGFTNTSQSFTVAVPGVYNVTVTDLSSTCSSTAIVTVGVHTQVSVTASITPATCSLGISNNDGKISVSGNVPLDKFDLVSGSTYTGSSTYTNAVLVPNDGVITANLANPTSTVIYTLRIFDAEGCVKDLTLALVPTDCIPKTLGVAKAVSAPILHDDGTYGLTYTVVVKNFDTAPMSNVVLTENLAATFPSPSSFTVTTMPSITSLNSSLSLNTGFNGSSQTSLTNTTSLLAAGKSDTLRFTVRVSANGVFGPFKNTVIAQAKTSNSVIVKDSSNVGLGVDPDTDSNPNNNNLSTDVNFVPDVFFGLTKIGSFRKVEGDVTSYDVTYTVTIHNLGNDTLRNVTIKDSLFGKAVPGTVSYSMRNAVSAQGKLVANSAFNGNGNINLIDPVKSKMPPRTTSSIVFEINVVTGTLSTATVLRNSAYGTAIKATPLGGNPTVSDTSNAGDNPDSNNNHVWNEAADNIPTILILPGIETYTLFIPEGFSPNDDGLNDYFQIKGLSDAGSNSLTIFNRWGNRVFYHENFTRDNKWDGRPNIAGTMGRDLLPQGTYYFILDMKGSGQKPITGFIVLQY